MGMPEATEREVNANSSTLFDKMIAIKLRKKIEQEMAGVIDNMELDDDSADMLNELMNEIMGDPKLKARIKARVLETLDENKLVDKVSTRIISQLLKA